MEYKTIYEYFKDYTEEEVDKVIKNLTDKAKMILKLKYGENLKKPTKINELNEQDNAYFEKNLMRLINKHLKRNREKLNSKRVKTIYEYFKDYSEEEIDMAIKNLSQKSKKILILKYGTDLKNPIRNKLTKTDERFFYGCVLSGIQRYLIKKQTNTEVVQIKTIYDYFEGYSIEEIDEAIKNLSVRAKNILRQKYGSDLKNPKCINKLDEPDRIYFQCTIIRTIKKRLYGKRNGLKMYIRPLTIYDYFEEYSKEEVDNIIGILPVQHKEIIMLKYGTDLENPIEKELTEEQRKNFRNCVLPMIRSKLLKSRREHKPLPLKTIYDYFKEYSIEEIDLVIESLSDKSREILELKFGPDFKNVKCVNRLTKSDTKFFSCDILPIMRKRLERNRINKPQIKRIYDYYKEFSEDEVDFVIESLSDKCKRILTLKYGTNLRNPKKITKLTKQDSNYFFSYIIKHIRRQLIKMHPSIIEERKAVELNEEIKNIPKEDYLKLLIVLKQFILNKLLDVLSYEEAIVVILKLILNYDTKVISNLLNISQEQVLEITKKFLLLYKDIKIKDIINNNSQDTNFLSK